MTTVSRTSLSRRYPSLARMSDRSRFFTPSSPTSSSRLMAKSMGGRAGAVRMASMASAMPALSSAPRMVSPRDVMTSPSSTGSIPRPGLTVSAWQASRMGAAVEFLPGQRATRLP